MRLHSLPTPPEDGSKPSGVAKSKPIKTAHRAAKRTGSNAGLINDSVAHGSSMDGRHKRVWKACERCRMKKTKCDGEFPCKRCKDDGLICTAGVRKKVEYKQLPRGYAEVLENTQFALVATVLKLYSMVRANGGWNLKEPDLNDRGQPVIHSIADILNCIRPNSDIDLPIHSVFPEDTEGLERLAKQLEEHHQRNGEAGMAWPPHNHSDSAVSSPEVDHSDYEHDHRKMAFGRENNSSHSSFNSPRSFATSNDFDYGTSNGAMPAFPDTTNSLFPSPQIPYSRWPIKMAEPQILENEAMMPTIQPRGMMAGNYGPDMLQQGLMESNFGHVKQHIVPYATQGVMMGMGDPMLYHGFDDEQTMRL